MLDDIICALLVELEVLNCIAPWPDGVDLVTLRSVEGAAEVLELEVVWQIDNRTAVASVGFVKYRVQ